MNGSCAILSDFLVARQSSVSMIKKNFFEKGSSLLSPRMMFFSLSKICKTFVYLYIYKVDSSRSCI